MRKPHTTFRLNECTAPALRDLAKELDIITPRGTWVGQGSASGLLDYIGKLVQEHGSTAIARRLEGK